MNIHIKQNLGLGNSGQVFSTIPSSQLQDKLEFKHEVINKEKIVEELREEMQFLIETMNKNNQNTEQHFKEMVDHVKKTRLPKLFKMIVLCLIILVSVPNKLYISKYYSQERCIKTQEQLQELTVAYLKSASANEELAIQISNLVTQLKTDAMQLEQDELKRSQKLNNLIERLIIASEDDSLLKQKQNFLYSNQNKSTKLNDRWNDKNNE